MDISMTCFGLLVELSMLDQNVFHQYSPFISTQI